MTATLVAKNVAGGLSILSFDGGTVAARASQTLMGPGAGGVGAVDGVWVQAGGASFDTAGKTMMGVAPDALGALVGSFDTKPAAYGANCGVGASDLLVAVLAMSAADPGAVLIAKANAAGVSLSELIAAMAAAAGVGGAFNPLYLLLGAAAVAALIYAVASGGGGDDDDNNSPS